jgi:hypothetical protein
MRTRRWMLWIGGGLLLVAAVALIAITRSSGAPYRFLEGHSPVSEEVSPDLRDSYRTVIYSFKGDYKTFIRQAHRELIDSRLEKRIHEGSGYFSEMESEEYAPIARLTTTGGKAPSFPLVFVVKDARVVKNGTTARLAPGWITVVIEDKDRPTWWDNVRAWMGL